jgi:hypothetical protein
MSKNYSEVLTTLQNCVDAIKNFQKRYDDEVAKINANQRALQAYNIAKADWGIRQAQRDERYRTGHWLTAPAGAEGWVWDGNVPVNCNSHQSSGGGPWNLCGYKDEISRKCSRCRDQHANSSKYLYADGDRGCNCASCAENCCYDCVSGNPATDIRYNSTSSFYTTYAQDNAADPPPTLPALYELIKISFDISCQACMQSVNIGNVTADKVDIGSVNQTMNCVTNQIKQVQNEAAQAAQNAKTVSDAKAAASVKAAADALAAQQAAQLALQQAKQKQIAAEAAAAAQSTTTTIILLVLFVFIVIVAALLAYTYLGSKKQQPQQPRPTYQQPQQLQQPQQPQQIKPF